MTIDLTRLTANTQTWAPQVRHLSGVLTIREAHEAVG